MNYRHMNYGFKLIDFRLMDYHFRHMNFGFRSMNYGFVHLFARALDVFHWVIHFEGHFITILLLNSIDSTINYQMFPKRAVLKPFKLNFHLIAINVNFIITNIKLMSCYDFVIILINLDFIRFFHYYHFYFFKNRQYFISLAKTTYLE